jgi:DNA-binding NarL/FixJ family response regulator
MTKIKTNKRTSPSTSPIKKHQQQRSRITSTKSAATETSKLKKSSLPTVSVGIADDHAFIREALHSVLSGHDGIEVVGEAENGRKAIEMAAAKRPDVLLMDIGMPRLNGLEAARQIRHATPGVKVILLTAFGNDNYIQHVIDGDIQAYLLKDSPSNLVAHAIREVAGGRRFFSPAISHRIRALSKEGPNGNTSGQQNGSKPVVKLTSREIEVLQLIAEGGANKQIASELNISIKTVEKHRQNLMDKLRIHDTASLTRYAISSGVIDNMVQTQMPF